MSCKFEILITKSLAQTWLERTEFMAMETIIMSRQNYFHIMSRQGRPKQIRMTEIQNPNHVEIV
jgi:hypothetical protein